MGIILRIFKHFCDSVGLKYGTGQYGLWSSPKLSPEFQEGCGYQGVMLLDRNTRDVGVPMSADEVNAW